MPTRPTMEMDQGQGELNSMAAATMSSVSIYNDDEPLQPPPPALASRSGVLVINAHCEYPAVANEADHDGFAVLLHVKAPPLLAAAPPLDLVAVLDVGESMAAGAKLDEVKRAMAFVVDRLGPRDRLSVVAFSGDGAAARRVIRLTRMTEHGNAAAKHAVDALAVSSGGSTTADVRAGLDEAAKVLDDCRQRNDVTGVILVSDGGGGHGSCAVPKFFLRDSGSGPLPVHTFVLGSDVDAAAMHDISKVTRGTFSFVEDLAGFQDAVAQCVAGLRSVTARDACIEIECSTNPHGDVIRVTAIKSGVPLGSRRRLETRLAFAVPRLSMLSKYRRLLLKR